MIISIDVEKHLIKFTYIHNFSKNILANYK